MEINKSYKKNLITLGVLSCFIGYAHEALSYPLINDQINTNTRYSNSELYIDTNHQIVGITLADESTLLMNGESQATDTVVEGHSLIHMYRYDEKTVGNPVIKNTTVNEYGSVHMAAGSLSVGQLFIGKDASLDIDNNKMGLTDVSVNTPAPAANVAIENLTLVGTAEIAPTWPSYQGEDGDAPLPEKPGPALITRIDNLNMQLGSKLSMTPYKSGVQFNRLELKNLSGEGDFYLTTSLADGLSDKIYVSDHASGNFGLQVKDSGREVKNPQNIQLVYINSGDARFNLLNNGGVVEAGIWQYKLYNKTDNGHTEWYLVGGQPGALPPPETNLPPDTNTGTPEEGNNTTSNPKLSNSARAVINLATAPRHILEAESSTLRQRMGDLRRNDGDVGVWARYLSDNSHFNDKGYSVYRTNLNGMQIGADKKLSINNGALLLGAFTSYSKSNIKSDNTNNGNMRSQSGGIYATWLDNSGFYIDTLLKANCSGTLNLAT
ncbi:autotransporter outer membrane beta-barrel domain-containing protein [Serratia sp. NPDC078593]|uniref:autotransporter outer membrane beta-barrel domain-containing protein n=1 Tax=unclassified Serratia (in: enterobacteria) TaxID=2647522 RepID=UPI0037D468DC